MPASPRRRRAFRPDQVPVAHQGAHRGSRTARRCHRGDRRHLPFDGPVARRLGAGRRPGAERDRRRPKPPSAGTGRFIPRVASTSAGVELLRNEIVVLGNSADWAGDLVIDHDVMMDAIDADAARRVLARLRGETVAVLAKAEAARRARSAAGATPCSTTTTSIRRATPAPWWRRAGRRDRRHAALCLGRRRAPGPPRWAGGDHWKGVKGSVTAIHSHAPLVGAIGKYRPEKLR